MVNAKTRKACENAVDRKMMAKMPRIGAKMPGGLKVTANVRNKTIKAAQPYMNSVRKMCGMTEKQKKKAAKKIFSKMMNRL